jgi:tryptophan 2,3-dioxygenase
MTDKAPSLDSMIPAPPAPGAMTYGQYLEVDALLGLQKPRSSPVEHDEMLFIVIHQVYELWFKLALHEAEKVRVNLFAGELYPALSTLGRIRHILKTLVGQLDILETMTPLSFASFRSRLDAASGFQSAQFREFEFMLGYKRPTMLRFHAEGGRAHTQLMQRLAEPSLVDALYAFLAKQGVAVPPALLSRAPDAPVEPNDDVQKALIGLYKTRPDLVLLFESLTDIDEGIQEWRYRHVKMVERTIGHKIGTGGSAGADYLRATLFRPLFPDLWAIRSQI